MKIILWIIVAVAVVGLGVFAYLRFVGAPPEEPVEPSVIPDKITEPVAASSYGKNAIGSESGEKVQPSELSPQEVGVLQGTAKPAPGARPNFSSITVSISDPQTNAVLDDMNLEAGGFYKFIVTPGEYVLKISGGQSDQLPRRIYVGKEEVITANFFVK